jgi:hypothetical protein
LHQAGNKKRRELSRAISRGEFSGVAVSALAGLRAVIIGGTILIGVIQAPCQRAPQVDMCGKINGLMPKFAPVETALLHA